MSDTLLGITVMVGQQTGKSTLKLKRRWPQFTVRSIMIFVLLLGSLSAIAFYYFKEPEPTVAELVEPIKIVSGGFLGDGGSVYSTLRDSNGLELTIVYTQDLWPTNNPYLSGRIYIGSPDAVFGGNGALVPIGGAAEAKLYKYIAFAVAEHDSAFVDGITGFENVWGRSDGMEVGCAKGLMQYIKTRIPAGTHPRQP